MNDPPLFGSEALELIPRCVDSNLPPRILTFKRGAVFDHIAVS